MFNIRNVSFFLLDNIFFGPDRTQKEWGPETPDTKAKKRERSAAPSARSSLAKKAGALLVTRPALQKGLCTLCISVVLNFFGSKRPDLLRRDALDTNFVDQCSFDVVCLVSAGIVGDRLSLGPRARACGAVVRRGEAAGGDPVWKVISTLP